MSDKDFFEARFYAINTIAEENYATLKRDPDHKIEMECNEGISEEEMGQYEIRIGYRFPESFRVFYQKMNGFKLVNMNEEFRLFTLEEIYEELKYNQKNDIYLHSKVPGYHIKIGKHPKGSLYINMNKEYFIAEDKEERYLYVSHLNGEKWLGVKDILTFMESYYRSFFYAFWQNIEAVEYFDEGYHKTELLAVGEK